MGGSPHPLYYYKQLSPPQASLPLQEMGGMSFCLLPLFITFVSSSPLTPGSIIVYRLGSSQFPVQPSFSSAAFLDEYDPDGALLQTIPIPSSRFSFATEDLNAGMISFSDDGSKLFFAGYSAPVNTQGVLTSNSSLIPRLVSSVSVSTGAYRVERTLPWAFSGDGGSAPGGVQSVCDSGPDLYATGVDAGNQLTRAAILDPTPNGDTRSVMTGTFSNCLITADSRLLAVASNGSVVALEDLHSFTPGLPDDERSQDPAYFPTTRYVTDGRSAGGRGISIGGGTGIQERLWLAHGSPTSCLTTWSMVDYTPTEFQMWKGYYLDAGSDLIPAGLYGTYAQAVQACLTFPGNNCTGCVVCVLAVSLQSLSFPLFNKIYQQSLTRSPTISHPHLFFTPSPDSRTTTTQLLRP